MTLHLLPERANVQLPVNLGERFGVAGDWHGNIAHATQVLHRMANEGVKTIVQLGDFGLWPGTRGANYLSALERTAASCGVTVYWVDGNHEDFDQLERVPFENETGLRRFSEHVWQLPRGARFTAQTAHGEVRFCAVGGATSLDRPNRTPGVSWWAQEELTAEQAFQIGEAGDTDVVFSHDCPAGVEIPGIAHRVYVNSWPARELERAWAHRELLAELVEKLKPTHLFHGHFHLSYESETEAFGAKTVVRGLAHDGAGMASYEIIETAALHSEVLARR